MKLTEDIIKAMGFRRLRYSSNPVCYHLLDPDRDFSRQVFIGQEINGTTDTSWSLRVLSEDCTNFVHELVTINDLMLAIGRHYFKLGDESRLSKLREAMGAKPCP